jgi:hypothetical protein
MTPFSLNAWNINACNINAFNINTATNVHRQKLNRQALLIPQSPPILVFFLILSLVVLVVSFSSKAGQQLNTKLSASEIHSTEVHDKKTNNGIVDISSFSIKDFIRLEAEDDRFDACRGAKNTAIDFARFITTAKDIGDKRSKADFFKPQASGVGLKYPFDAQEIASQPYKSAEKLALEMGWQYQSHDAGKLDKLNALYWQKCLSLPIAPFEADNTYFDKDSDKEGLHMHGISRVNNVELYGDYKHS